MNSNSLHPGFVRSGFGPGNKGLMGRVWALAGHFAILEEGAITSLRLASAPGLSVSGGYFVKAREVRPAPHALDDAAGRRLWQLSEAYVDRLQ